MKGSELKQIIKAARHTQESAAALLQVSRQTLTVWMARETIPRDVEASVRLLFPAQAEEIDIKQKVFDLEQTVRNHINLQLDTNDQLRKEVRELSIRLEEVTGELSKMKAEKKSTK